MIDASMIRFARGPSRLHQLAGGLMLSQTVPTSLSPNTVILIARVWPSTVPRYLEVHFQTCLDEPNTAQTIHQQTHDYQFPLSTTKFRVEAVRRSQRHGVGTVNILRTMISTFV